MMDQILPDRDLATAPAKAGQPPHILVAEPIAAAAIEYLRSVTVVDQRFDIEPATLIAEIPRYDALIVRSATRVTAAVIAAGRRLRVIGRVGSGMDNIDILAATASNITVVNAPDANTTAVAELTMALMLAIARYLPQAAASLSSGAWIRTAFIGSELRGKTLGLIGLGRIGSAVAHRAQAFEMLVLGHDPWVSPTQAQKCGVCLVDLDELLLRSDYISLHVPLTSETRGLLSRRRLASIKPSAYLINTARGHLIDEEALVALLNSGRCAGAALDVFAHEPPLGSPLIGHPRVLASPHIGAATVEAQEHAGLEVASQVVDILCHRDPTQRLAHTSKDIPQHAIQTTACSSIKD